MRGDYERWLREQQYDQGTIANQLHRVRKVEEAYGSLDDLVRSGMIDDTIDQLRYSTSDERKNRPNPSKIAFQGNIRKNLQSYKSAVVLYRRFASGQSEADEDVPAVEAAIPNLQARQTDAASLNSFSLERDMQRAIRDDISALGSGLRIVDEGVERAVDSGRVDITCENVGDGSLVVIEMKAGKADARAVAQILGYMGDLSEEEAPRLVRGILVAHGFDQRARSAARMVPSLQLLKYSIRFEFNEIGDV